MAKKWENSGALLKVARYGKYVAHLQKRLKIRKNVALLLKWLKYGKNVAHS